MAALNRLLALTIDLQNALFGAFEELLQAKIEGARTAGTYDVGVETLTAESLVVTARSMSIPRPVRRPRSSPSAGASAIGRSASRRRWTVRMTHGLPCW